MDNRKLKAFVALYKRKYALEDELKEVASKIAAAEPYIQENMLNGGQSLIACDDRKVKLNRSVVASVPPSDKKNFHTAMIVLGHDAMIKEGINPSTFNAFVREYDPDKELMDDEITAALPEEIRSFVNVYIKYQAKVTKT